MTEPASQDNKRKKPLPMGRAQKRLTTTWFVGSGILFLLLFFQTLFGRFGNQVGDAFGWLLPSVLPTLMLIVGVLAWDALGKVEVKKTVDRYLFKLAFGLSILYFIVLILVLLIQPFTSSPILKIMAQSHFYLGPLQGLVAACLGIFFVKKAREHSNENGQQE